MTIHNGPPEGEQKRTLGEDSSTRLSEARPGPQGLTDSGTWNTATQFTRQTSSKKSGEHQDEYVFRSDRAVTGSYTLTIHSRCTRADEI